MLALSNGHLKQTIEQKSIPTSRDASTMQLGISDRGSLLARDDRDDTASLRAGDRGPNATMLTTVEGERRLFDLTRSRHFTLLNFGPAVTIQPCTFKVRTLQVVVHPGGPNEIGDSRSHLASAYGAIDRTLVLIRPDGYIALISDPGDPSSVSDYLARANNPVTELRSL